MTPTQLARVCALLGGLAWGFRWLLSVAEADEGAISGAYWAGLALLTIGFFGGATALVRAAWLRPVVGLAATGLVWSVLFVVHDTLGDDPLAPNGGIAVDGLFGLAVVVLWTPVLWRSGTGRRPSAGAHSL